MLLLLVNITDACRVGRVAPIGAAAEPQGTGHTIPNQRQAGSGPVGIAISFGDLSSRLCRQVVILGAAKEHPHPCQGG